MEHYSKYCDRLSEQTIFKSKRFKEQDYKKFLYLIKMNFET